MRRSPRTAGAALLLVAGLLSGLASSCGPRKPRATPPPPAAALPDGDAWVAHIRDELAPFWTRPEALGTPVGNFPTFRCDDGTLHDPALPCSELRLPGRWVSGYLDREYTRMKSRQTYFYGVAFHLTGEARFLELSRAGVEWIRANALDPGTGSAVSWWKDGVAEPPVGQRTAQDLAYAAVGLAFHAYLTRDPGVTADVLRLKRHVFSTYGDPSWGMLRWTREGPGAEVARKELVATLDQVNAYLLLLATIVPEPQAGELRADLVRLCQAMVGRYWSEEHGLFRGTLTDPVEPFLGSRHVDFGHTVKALWMIERVGRLCGDEALVRFAVERIPSVLARAYLPSVGCWASGIRRDGSLDAGLTWWIFAELDQAAATLALSDRRYTGYLARTYACWRQRLVDRAAGEVFAFADPDDPSRRIGKAHLWKSGYHSAEHALVAYLTAQELKGRPARLHFAFRELPPSAMLHPYFFGGEVERVEESGAELPFGLRPVTVSFRNVR